jgi:hypothetical protein
MTQVYITENNTSVIATTTENSVVVTTTPNTITINDSVAIGASLVKHRYLGTAFTGNSGDPFRSITLAGPISSSAFVILGKAVLDDPEYSLSTTSLTNDTITINTNLFNDDVVLLWTT